jgi:phosphatidylserine decarboxylase
MAKDAYRFLLALAILAVLFWLMSPWAALLPAVLFVFVVYFFRNPHREIPSGRNLIVSPADGKVVKVSELPDGSGHNISIFLNIFDVHVNRAPVQGKICDVQYKRGLFKVAYDDEASRVNEQNVITILGQGIQVTVKQVAGLIARRVICWKKPGENVARGELFGLIRFGSRVDVLVPKDVRITVNVGDRVKGGSSILGEHA